MLISTRKDALRISGMMYNLFDLLRHAFSNVADSNLFRASVSVYDARTNLVTNTISIDGITGHPEMHISGVRVDGRHDKLSIIANAGAAFDTAGQVISGDNFLVQYDLGSGRVEWMKNLTAVSNGVYGGFQDVEHDSAGNSFVIGTFPSSIIKVSADGQNAIPWLVAANTSHNVQGYAGIAAYNRGRNVLVNDDERGQILRFDTTAEHGQLIHVPLQSGAEPIGRALDGSYLPSLYDGTVYLVSDNDLGTIVIRANDREWTTAQKLGVIPNAYASEGGSTTASVQIGDRIYVVTEFFVDAQPGNALNRTLFPLHDITDDVNKLLDG